MVSKNSDRGDYSKRSISDFGAFTTSSVPPHFGKGASCLGFGAPPSELGRQIGTVGLLIELIAGVSYCTKSCQLATRSFARKLTITAKKSTKKEIGQNWPQITILNYNLD